MIYSYEYVENGTFPRLTQGLFLLEELRTRSLHIHANTRRFLFRVSPKRLCTICHPGLEA